MDQPMSTVRFESKPREQSVHDIPVDELLRRAVKSARDRHKRGYHPRWVGVMHTFQLGSTYAAQLCRMFGLDPDEKVR